MAESAHAVITRPGKGKLADLSSRKGPAADDRGRRSRRNDGSGPWCLFVVPGNSANSRASHARRDAVSAGTPNPCAVRNVPCGRGSTPWAAPLFGLFLGQGCFDTSTGTRAARPIGGVALLSRVLLPPTSPHTLASGEPSCKTALESQAAKLLWRAKLQNCSGEPSWKSGAVELLGCAGVRSSGRQSALTFHFETGENQETGDQFTAAWGAVRPCLA